VTRPPLRIFRRAAAAALALAALALARPAFAAKTDDILKGIEDLQQQVLLLSKEQARSAESLSEIRRKLDEQAGASQNVQADLLQQINSLLDEIQILRQRLEDTSFRMANLTQEVRRLQAAPGAPQSAPAGAPGGAASTTRADAGPDAAFQSAYADYSKGNYELALWGFQDFVRKYPTETRASEAQYWMGECHFAQKDFKQAVAELDRLIQQYPDSSKVPAAHLKKGLAFLELKEVPQAVVQLQHLVQTYPHSDEARIARERLKTLGLR